MCANGMAFVLLSLCLARRLMALHSGIAQKTTFLAELGHFVAWPLFNMPPLLNNKPEFPNLILIE